MRVSSVHDIRIPSRVCLRWLAGLFYRLMSAIGTYPVKNIFPILADSKLNTELGLALLTISKFSKLSTERISSFLGGDMSCHR